MKDYQQQVKDMKLTYWARFSMSPHPLTNFEIQKYYQNKPRFKGVYSRNNLPKIKDGAYIINSDY